jgi:hypothetical protein
VEVEIVRLPPVASVAAAVGDSVVASVVAVSIAVAVSSTTGVAVSSGSVVGTGLGVAGVHAANTTAKSINRLMVIRFILSPYY